MLQDQTNIQLKTSFQTLPADGESHLLYVLARVAPKIAAAPRLPLNLSILLDTSGSMREHARLVHAQLAIKRLVDILRAEDTFSLTTFSTNAEVVASGKLSANQEKVKRQIEQIQASGTTNLHAGLKLAYEQVARHQKSEWINAVILLTDGRPNARKGILPLVQESARKGVPTSTIGVGEEFDKVMLQDIAAAGCGRVYFVEDANILPQIFDQEMSALQMAAPVYGELRIRTSAGVSVRNTFLVEPLLCTAPIVCVGERVYEIGLGYVYPGKASWVVAELLVPGRSPGQTRLAHIEFVANRASQTTADVVVTFGPPMPAKPDPDVQDAVACTNVLQLLDRVLEMEHQGDKARGAMLLRALATQLRERGARELAQVARTESKKFARRGKLSVVGARELNRGVKNLGLPARF
jgi:uncharacterized protein YegL